MQRIDIVKYRAALATKKSSFYDMCYNEVVMICCKNLLETISGHYMKINTFASNTFISIASFSRNLKN